MDCSPRAKRARTSTPSPPAETDQSDCTIASAKHTMDSRETSKAPDGVCAAASALLPSPPPALTAPDEGSSTSADSLIPRCELVDRKDKVFRQSKLSFHPKANAPPPLPPSPPSPPHSDGSPASPLEQCSHLSELCFGPSAFPTLTTLPTSTPHHCLLFDASTLPPSHPHTPTSPPQPHPKSFKDVWDSNHVRMPCSAQNLYPVADGNGTKKLQPRWDMIRKALSGHMTTSHDLEAAILSYNYQYAKKWRFTTLHTYFASGCSEDEGAEFFSRTLPAVVRLALELPNMVTHALPLLKQRLAYSVSLSQQQVACLLANAFLCTFPRRNTTKPGSEYSSYPSINFSSLLCGRGDSVQVNKLKCIVHYLHRVTSRVPVGVVTFTRQVLPSPPPQWGESPAPLSRLCADHSGTIEDNGAGMLQVDFANRFLGGGVLGAGCVQEEIRFLICPELIVSRLFTESLAAEESLLVTGAERYSDYSGYASSFEWQGRHDDSTVRDVWGRRQTRVVAIDAAIFHSTAAQLKPGMMCRELNKAYCGFMTTEATPCGRGMAVATGNWGCGAFGGNVRLKALLQLLAAAQARRDVMYFTFGDRSLRQDLVRLHRSLVCEGVTVGRVWRALLHCQSHFDPRGDLYGFILSALELSGSDSSQATVASGNNDLATLEYSLDAC